MLELTGREGIQATRTTVRTFPIHNGELSSSFERDGEPIVPYPPSLDDPNIELQLYGPDLYPTSISSFSPPSRPTELTVPQSPKTSCS
jgi:hypothetical protein